MNIARKLVAAVATASMLVTSFVSFATVASAATTKPTVTAELMSIDDLKTFDAKATETHSVGVKISFTNFRTSLRSFVINLNLATANIKGRSNTGGATSMSATSLASGRILYYPYTEEEIENEWDDPSYPFWNGWKDFIVADDAGEGYKRLNMIWTNWADSEGSGGVVYFDPSTNANYFVLSLRKTNNYEIQDGDIVITKSNLQLGYSDVDPVLKQDEFELVDLINSSSTNDPAIEINETNPDEGLERVWGVTVPLTFLNVTPEPAIDISIYNSQAEEGNKYCNRTLTKENGLTNNFKPGTNITGGGSALINVKAKVADANVGKLELKFTVGGQTPGQTEGYVAE